MRQYRIAIQITFESEPHGTDEQYEEFLDAVQEHLDAIGREVQMSASLVERTAEFATSIEAPSFKHAAAALQADLRTALHVAGCHTDGWPQYTPTGMQELQDA